MKYLILPYFLLSFLLVPAQDEIAYLNDEASAPEYPGGINAMHDQIQKGVKYPASAKRNGIEGVVDVAFTVHTDGSISNLHVLKGIGFGCDLAAIQAVAKLDGWKPAQLEGEAIAQEFEVPVLFFLPKRHPKPKMKK